MKIIITLIFSIFSHTYIGDFRLKGFFPTSIWILEVFFFFCTIKFIKFFQAPLPVLIIRTNHTNYNVKKEHKHVCQFENYVDNLHYAIM